MAGNRGEIPQMPANSEAGEQPRDTATPPGGPSGPAIRGRRQRSRWRRWVRRCILLAAIAALIVGVRLWQTRPRPTPPTVIFRGVTYTCFEANDPECRGLVHVVRVDLSTPGIQLYLTPLDPQALARGWQYRLDSAASVLKREHLAVVVNGTYFTSDSGWIQWSGDLARSLQTIVADGRVNQVDPNSYLLWFAADLTPHLEFAKPPPAAVLRQARWGIGGGGVPLWQGNLRPAAAGHAMDRRTAIAIDTRRKLLWLAIFEDASSTGVARVLARQGAQDGILLDGGHSTTMVIGPQARGIRSGELLHGWRPVATFFGIRAAPLK